MSDQLLHAELFREINIPAEEQRLAQYAREMIAVANNYEHWLQPERVTLTRPPQTDAESTHASWEYETDQDFTRIAVGIGHRALYLYMEDWTVGQRARIHGTLAIGSGSSHYYSRLPGGDLLTISDFKDEFLTTAKAFRLIERAPQLQLIETDQKESSVATSERVA